MVGEVQMLAKLDVGRDLVLRYVRSSAKVRLCLICTAPVEVGEV